MKRIFALVLAVVMLALCLTACNSGPDFDDVFELRGVTYEEHTLSAPERVAYAGLVTEDTLEVYEIGYEGDTIKAIYKTFYLNVEQYDAVQRENVRQSMQERFASVEIDGVKLTHEIADKYYVMRAEITALDSASALAAVSAAGLADFIPQGAESLKLSDVESSLVNNGFVKR